MIRSFDFYFDFISPYSYLAHMKIRRIEIKKNIQMNYKPIFLGGLHKLVGITAPAFINPKAKFMIKDCKMVAKKFNIRFNFNSFFPINSINLMRGLLIIKNNVKNNYIDNFFEAYWQEGLNLGDEKTFFNVLKKCNIKKNDFLMKIENKKTKDRLRKLTKDAYMKDIFGAPTFVVNKKIFWGQDRLDYALDEFFKKN